VMVVIVVGDRGGVDGGGDGGVVVTEWTDN
jgi:hypothetical protein